MGIDPATLAMIGGSVLGAGGNVAGGFLGGGGFSSGDMINSFFNPSLNLASQAAEFNTLSGLGFGNASSLPDPVQQLVGKLQALPIDERTKRRALASLSSLRTSVGRGTGFDEALGNAPRKVALQQALKNLGLSKSDLPGVFDEQRRFEEQVQRLQNEGLNDINVDTILNRSRAANTASQLIGSAANFATGAEPDALQRQLLDRDNRSLRDLQTQLGLRANFGGINPAVFGQTFSDQALDQNLRVLEQTLGVSSALQGALAPYTQAAGQSADRSFNAAQLSAQQAQAANQLRAQAAQNQSSSLASGISSAAGGLGSALSNAGLFSLLNRQQPTPTTQGGQDFLNFGGPGSTANQTRTATARSGGFNPIVNF